MSDIQSRFQCPACKLVCGHVWGLHGGSAWVRIEPKQVEFYSLTERPLGRRGAAGARRKLGSIADDLEKLR